MLAGVHHLHHEVVGTRSYLTAAHQKEEQLLLKSWPSLVLSINDITSAKFRNTLNMDTADG